MKTKQKKAVKGPAIGSPEYMAKIRKMRGKGKRKGPSWKKKLTTQVSEMSKMIKRMAKAQGVKIPKVAKKAVRRKRR
jgi:hypothetical protein